MRTYHATLLLALLVPGLPGCGRKPEATTDAGSSGGDSDSAGKFGICGQCNSDADCQGLTCAHPLVDLESGTLTPATCG